jgi:DNA-binding protein Fis
MAIFEEMDKELEELRKEVVGKTDDEIYDLYLQKINKTDFCTDTRFFKRHHAVNRVFVVELMGLARASLKQKQ